MTWLGDVLSDMASESPQADLAERTIRIHRRRRHATLALTAAATAVVVAATVVGVTAGVRLLPAPPQQQAAYSVTIPDLPERGVGPLSHAYKTFCHPSDGKVPPDCREGEWRVVATDGRTYHVSEALRSVSPFTTGMEDSPLAISKDGRKIAYYAQAKGTFVVRDLATGEQLTAPTKVPQTWLGSITHLMLSDDGRFLAFTKGPTPKAPAMLFDLREQRARPLPDGWSPIGLSKDGDTMTLAEFSPKPGLKKMSNLWTSSKAGKNISFTFPEYYYYFSPLAPDGKTIVALEDYSTSTDPCEQGKLVHVDAATGKLSRRIPLSGLSMATLNISLRGWLNPREVVAVTAPDPQCTDERPATKDEGQDGQRTDPPFHTFTAYAVDVETGKSRPVGTYTAQGFFQLVLPGPAGAF